LGILPHTTSESTERERKRAKEQEEEKKEEEEAKVEGSSIFSTPDLRSSFIMTLSISLFVYLDRSMTCE
jgi:hypothetical protein